MDPTDEDDSFRRLVGKVKPLKSKERSRSKATPVNSGKKLYFKKTAFDTITHPITAQRPDNVTADTPLFFKRARLAHTTLKRLKTGQIPYQGKLDLHGMSWENAKHTLESFFTYHRNQGSRMVLIIHGKSRHSPYPILKNELNHWLRCQPYVTAFTSALPRHGGTGAVYVLLS